jgi:hypothetical protein
MLLGDDDRAARIDRRAAATAALAFPTATPRPGP